MDWNILERAYAVRVLLAVDADPGRPKTAYMTYSNTRSVFTRLAELEEAGLLRSEKGERYRALLMHPTALGHRLAEALREAVEAHGVPEPTEDTSEAPKPWIGHACDDCGNARIGRCVDCANYQCDEDLGPCCRRDGAFRLVAFPYGPGCDRWRGEP